MPDAQAPILSARNIKRSFRMGESTIQVLRGASIELLPGEFVAIEGRSGSGKSTLMHILGALDTADEGQIFYDGADLAGFSASGRARIRNAQFGFVFQFYHLLPELDVLENTLLAAMVMHSPLRYRANRARLHDRARSILDQLGLSHRLRHRPQQLSGGERQRVAIARALMNQPRVLFADEPTGNLDEATGLQIMDVIEKLHREQNQTIVMVTHDRALAKRCDRVLVMQDGILHAA